MTSEEGRAGEPLFHRDLHEQAVPVGLRKRQRVNHQTQHAIQGGGVRRRRETQPRIDGKIGRPHCRDGEHTEQRHCGGNEQHPTPDQNRRVPTAGVPDGEPDEKDEHREDHQRGHLGGQGATKCQRG
jgi:hypothetical protein